MFSYLMAKKCHLGHLLLFVPCLRAGWLSQNQTPRAMPKIQNMILFCCSKLWVARKYQLRISTRERLAHQYNFYHAILFPTSQILTRAACNILVIFVNSVISLTYSIFVHKTFPILFFSVRDLVMELHPKDYTKYVFFMSLFLRFVFQNTQKIEK